MRYRIFQYPLPCPEEPAELNAFLSSHRIVSVQQYLAQFPGGTALVFVAQFVQASARESESQSARVDYRERLSEQQFQLFSRLRDVRKALAKAEGIPVYAVFSNAQLAEMAEKGVASVADLQKIEGVGASRIQKYGEPILAALIAGLNLEPAEAAVGDSAIVEKETRKERT